MHSIGARREYWEEPDKANAGPFRAHLGRKSMTYDELCEELKTILLAVEEMHKETDLQIAYLKAENRVALEEARRLRARLEERYGAKS